MNGRNVNFYYFLNTLLFWWIVTRQVGQLSPGLSTFQGRFTRRVKVPRQERPLYCLQHQDDTSMTSPVWRHQHLSSHLAFPGPSGGWGIKTKKNHKNYQIFPNPFSGNATKGVKVRNGNFHSFYIFLLWRLPWGMRWCPPGTARWPGRAGLADRRERTRGCTPRAGASP